MWDNIEKGLDDKKKKKGGIAWWQVAAGIIVIAGISVLITLIGGIPSGEDSTLAHNGVNQKRNVNLWYLLHNLNQIYSNFMNEHPFESPDSELSKGCSFVKFEEI